MEAVGSGINNYSNFGVNEVQNFVTGSLLIVLVTQASCLLQAGSLCYQYCYRLEACVTNCTSLSSCIAVIMALLYENI